MKNLTKNLLLGLFVLSLGACGSDENQQGYQPYYPGAISGLACAELSNVQKLGVFFGNLGNGAKFGVDIYQSTGDQVAMVGDIYIPDIQRFWNLGLYNPTGQAQEFVSCLSSSGFNGTMTSQGTGAYRFPEIVLEGNGIVITLGGSLPGTSNSTLITGNNIVGPALIQMNGGEDIFILKP